MLQDTEYTSIKLLKSVISFYNAPRSGHTKDITKFYSDNLDERKDYIQGLFFVFAILMVIAATWFVGLIILRLLGHRAGCASGKPAVIPAEPMGDKNGSVNTEETGEFIVMQSDQNRVNYTRIFFFVSVLYTLAASGVLFYSLVVTQSSTSEYYNYAEDIKDVFAAVPANWETFLETSSEFETEKEELILSLETFCPSGTSGTIEGEDAAELTDEYRVSLEDLFDLTTDVSWKQFNASLAEMNDMFEDIIDFIGFMDGATQPWYWGSLIALGLLILLTFYLLVAAWKAGKEGYEFVGEAESNLNTKFLNYVGIPLFAVLVAGAWFTASVGFAAAASNADFCYSEINEGQTLLNMLVERGYDESTYFYKTADEYLHGCVDGGMSHLPTADTYDVALTNAMAKSEKFTGFDEDDLDAACGGGGDASAVLAQARDVTTQLTSLTEDYNTIYDGISCENMATMVQKAVYENSCHSLSKALVWVFASALSVAGFGTILLSLRSATSRPQIYLVPAGQDDNNSYIIDSEDGSYDQY